MVTQLNASETEEPPAKIRRLEQIIAEGSTPTNLTSSRENLTGLGYSEHQSTSDLNSTNQSIISPIQTQQTPSNNNLALQPTSNLNPTCQSTSSLSPNQQSSSNPTQFCQISSNLDRAYLPENNLNSNYQTIIDPSPNQQTITDLNPILQSTNNSNRTQKTSSNHNLPQLLTCNMNPTYPSVVNLALNQQSGSSRQSNADSCHIHEKTTNLTRTKQPIMNLNLTQQTTSCLKRTQQACSNLNPTNQPIVTRNPVDKSTNSLTQQPTSNLDVSNQSININPSRHSTANLTPNQLPNTNCNYQLTSRPVVEGCSRKDITFLCISNSSVRCWIFPVAMALNKIDDRRTRGNFSCTIISFVLGKALVSLSIKCPDDGVLSELWYGLVINCIRLGNRIYDSSPQGARNLSPNEAASTLRDVSPVKLEATLPVRLADSSSASRLGFQINEKMKGQDATALYTVKELRCSIVIRMVK